MRIVLSRCFVVLVIGMVMMSRSAWTPSSPWVLPLFLTAGLGMAGVAMAGRMWCSLYIAGYKDKKLLHEGPYSICRHPLYLFSFIGAVGVALATGTFTIPLLVASAFAIYYKPVIEAEEARLRLLFGADCEEYQNSVPRMIPRLSQLRQPESWPSAPPVFTRHLLSVIWFAPASGVILLLTALRDVVGWTPPVVLY